MSGFEFSRRADVQNDEVRVCMMFLDNISRYLRTDILYWRMRGSATQRNQHKN